MTDITDTIAKAIQDRQKNSFGQVLSDVAKGFALCGFFQLDHWEEILHSNFNGNFINDVKSPKKNTKKTDEQMSVPKSASKTDKQTTVPKSASKRKVSNVFPEMEAPVAKRTRRLTIENKPVLSNSRIATRRQTIVTSLETTDKLKTVPKSVSKRKVSTPKIFPKMAAPVALRTRRLTIENKSVLPNSGIATRRRSIVASLETAYLAVKEETPSKKIGRNRPE